MPITAEDLANTFWGGVLRDMWGAAKLPGDVYAGRVDPTSDEGIKRAADLAGLGFTGGMGRAAMAPAAEVSLGSGGGTAALRRPPAVDWRMPTEPVNPAGQLRLNLGDEHLVGTEYDWMARMRDLPPDEAARQLRAWEQNYDPLTYYHGTGSLGTEIRAFDLDKAASGANAGHLKKEKAVFLTDDPEIANTYFDQDTYRNSIYPLRVRDVDQFARFDWDGDLYNREVAWQQLQEAKKEGRPGLIWENMLDPGPYAKPDMEGYEDEAAALADQFPTSRILAVFDPSRVRSAFAKFDPRRKHESDLLASSSPPIAALSEGEQDKKKSKKADKSEDKDAEAEAKAWKAFLKMVSDGGAL